MAQRLFNLVRQAGKARAQLLALSGASTGLIAFGLTEEQQTTRFRFSLPGLTPVALADARAEAQQSVGKSPANVSIALTGFEDVKDVNGFVSSALDKTLKYQKNSPLQSIVAQAAPQLPKHTRSTHPGPMGRGASSRPQAPGSPAASPQSFGEQTLPTTIEPAAFYAQLEKQPLAEKVMILDDIVDTVVREAERYAEAAALTVGMVGGGVACYALLGWWSDMALPGVGTVACSAVAGAAGHNRAKAAAKRTRSRFLNAILSTPLEGRNAFVDYLSAPSLDVKQRIASETKPAAFFRDFFIAVQPLLQQATGGQGNGSADAAGLAVLGPID